MSLAYLRFRPKGLGFVLLGAVLVAMLSSVGLQWRRRVALTRWNAAAASVDKLQAQLEERTTRRAALWGEARDEPAQRHYLRALELVASIELEALQTAREINSEHTSSARSELLTMHAGAVQSMRRGAHALETAREFEDLRDQPLLGGKLSNVSPLIQLCELQAAAHLEAGQDSQAVQVLLDALQFAGDLSQGPFLIDQLVGVELLCPGLLVDAVANGSVELLAPAARQQLAEGCAALEQRLDWRTPGPEGELFQFVRHFRRNQQTQGAGTLTATLASLWPKLGESQSLLMAAEYLTASHEFCGNRMVAVRSGPNTLFHFLEGVAQEPRESQAAPAAGNLHSYVRGRLRGLARFKLLAHALSGNEEPRDPWLAAHLRIAEVGNASRLWIDHGLFEEVELFVHR